jgi:hypothetical protein
MRKKKEVQKSKYDATLLTPAQAREIEKEIQEQEKMFKQFGSKISDPASFFKDVAKKKRILRDHRATKLTGAEANRAYARAKEIEGKLQEIMPTRREFYRPYPNEKTSMEHEGDFNRTVDRQIRIQTDPAIKQMMHEYKHIMRRLDPDDPGVSNIERLRR